MIVVAFACYGKLVKKESVFNHVKRCVERERGLIVTRITVRNAYYQYFREMFDIGDVYLDSDAFRSTSISRDDELPGWGYIPSSYDSLNVGTAFEYFSANQDVKHKAMTLLRNYLRGFKEEKSRMIIVEDASESIELEMLNEFSTLTVFIDSRKNARSASLYNLVRNNTKMYGKTTYVTCVKGEPYKPIVAKRVTDHLFTLPDDMCLPIIHLKYGDNGTMFDRKICTGNRVKNICRHYNGPNGCLNFLATKKRPGCIVPPRFKSNWKCYEETPSESLRQRPLLHAANSVNNRSYKCT